MIQLVSKNLSNDSTKTLKELQDTVNSEATFSSKSDKAKVLWNSKTSSKKKEKCFDEVKKVLKGMCVSLEICNYCENNEANDIEHIHPKSFFPNLTFEWDNYLLACKQCNSGYKLDKCNVIDAHNILSLLQRGTEPPLGSTVAFINPRLENPNNYMLLDLGADGIEGTWRYMVLPDLSLLETQKAKVTLEILKLNTRTQLIQARKNAATFYFERIDRLVRIMETESFNDLKNILSPYDNKIDLGLTLEENKNNIKAGFKKSIQTHQHPSVWYSIIKIQSKVNNKWKGLFDKLPEALKW